MYQLSPKAFVQSNLPDSYVLKIPEGKQWFDYPLPPFFRYYDQFDFKK